MSFGFSSLTTVLLSGTFSQPVPVLSWAPCGDDFPGVECATAAVPLDYDHPLGATTQIALARAPASDPANRIGSVFLNPGGPGGSGVNMVLFGYGAYLDSALQGRFDIVGFDPRGVAASSPLQCFDTEEDAGAFIADVPIFPYLHAQERPFFDAYRALGDQCFGRGNPITAHMSTADVVRDLDLLRQAVGDSHLTYLGFSYGSFIGNTYANMFPNHVRALVIDGVLDPRLWSSSLQVVSDRVATEEELDEFMRLCDEAGDDCALNGPEGSRARFDELADAILASPVVFESGFVYSYDYLIADSTGAMYAPEYWGGPDGYAAFFDLLADAVAGVPEAGTEADDARQAIEARIRAASPQRADYNNGFEAYYGNHCADAAYPSSLTGFRVVDAFAESGSIFGPYWWWSSAGCADWPTSSDRYAGPWSTRTASPVLVVGNFFDGVTDYRGAQASNRLLRNSRLLSYAGWGHTAFGRSDCVTDYVIAYLLDGTLPPEGTVCPANPNPFVPVAQALSSFAAAPTAPMIGLPPVVRSLHR